MDSLQITKLRIKVRVLSIPWHNLDYLQSLRERFLNALGLGAVFLRTVFFPLQSPHYLLCHVPELSQAGVF